VKKYGHRFRALDKAEIASRMTKVTAELPAWAERESKENA